MHPLIAEYDSWWAGPQGALADELNSFCGPKADGWRNRDVLNTCNSIKAVDCAHLVGHCDADVEAMRERVEELAQEARRVGESLLSDFAQVSPPRRNRVHTQSLPGLSASTDNRCGADGQTGARRASEQPK